jgi:acylphosphatase
MKQFHILIRGDVQGTGFRSWMKREAENLSIAGWVKNREDGTVEAIVQGEEGSVKKIVELCRKGPDISWVERVDITEQPVNKGLITFEVVY